MLEAHIRFKVNRACGDHLSHRFSGNFGSTEKIHTITWCLNVCMDCSAQFWRCITAGVNWKSTP